MFDTIVLLTGQVEQPVLSSLFLKHNPRLTIEPVETAEHVAALQPELLRRARLIAFTTAVVVPPRVLDQLGYGGYNFHPGPPDYPGWAPSHFALYQQATRFGATAHLMAEKVDAGPIIDTESFDIPEGTGVEALEALAYAALARLVWRLAEPLTTRAEPLPQLPLRWAERKNFRRTYAALCDIPLDISKEEFDRRINVFGGNHFGMHPTVSLHGVRFRIMPEQEAGLARL